MPPVRGSSSAQSKQNNPGLDSSEAEVQPPRPPNAWILYRSAKLTEMPKDHKYGNTMAEISKVIGAWWKNESAAIKAHYNELARIAKEDHARKYPHYKFRPVKKEDKARLPPKPRASSRSTSGGQGARARAAPYHIPATAPATPARTATPALVHPTPQVMQLSAEQIYALQCHAVQYYGAAGPSPPMDAWDGDDSDISLLVLSEPDSPELLTPPTSLLEPSPSTSVSPQLFPTHSTSDTDTPPPPQLFMPESSELPTDDMLMPTINNFGWDPSSTDMMGINFNGDWPADLQAMLGAHDGDSLLLDSLPPDFDLYSSTFDLDFANNASSGSGQPLYTPEFISLQPDAGTNEADINTMASFDFGFVPTLPDVSGATQSPPSRDPALQEQNLPTPPTVEEAPAASTSKYQPPAGAAHSANRRVGGKWRPQVLTSD